MYQPHILLFGAGKSATCLIDYLLIEAAQNKWRITVADGNLQAAQLKIGAHSYAKAIEVNVENAEQRTTLVKDADIVVSLLPPALHYKVAKDCINFRKHLLTASYVDENMNGLRGDIKESNLLFLCEMGLDPGIDHMSAMQLINNIKQQGGIVHSFKSHCGGLIAPESDNNPWHYKISWNPRNVVLAGKAGAIYKEKGEIKQKMYEKIFKDCDLVTIEDLHKFAWYPNRDSISYIPIYGLEQAHTFIRTTLRYASFCKAWLAIVAANLTDDTIAITHPLSYDQWSKALTNFGDKTVQEALSFLGVYEQKLVPSSAKTSADVLQYLLEKKLSMQSSDKDMVVMLHQLEYQIQHKHYRMESSLIVKGEDNVRTAMAKTVGLPIGIAAKLIIQKKINLTGLQIPILPEIYEPVLEILRDQKIAFIEKKAIL